MPTMPGAYVGDTFSDVYSNGGYGNATAGMLSFTTGSSADSMRSFGAQGQGSSNGTAVSLNANTTGIERIMLVTIYPKLNTDNSAK